MPFLRSCASPGLPGLAGRPGAASTQKNKPAGMGQGWEHPRHVLSTPLPRPVVPFAVGPRSGKNCPALSGHPFPSLLWSTVQPIQEHVVRKTEDRCRNTALMGKRIISSKHLPAREQIQLAPREDAAGVAVACRSLSPQTWRCSRAAILTPFPSLLTSLRPRCGSALSGWDNQSWELDQTWPSSISGPSIGVVLGTELSRW